VELHREGITMGGETCKTQGSAGEPALGSLGPTWLWTQSPQLTAVPAWAHHVSPRTWSSSWHGHCWSLLMPRGSAQGTYKPLQMTNTRPLISKEQKSITEFCCHWWTEI